MTRVLMAVALLGLLQPPATYQFDAAGRRARVEQTWQLRSSGDAISVFTSVARCGQDLFLSDTQHNIFRVDARQPASSLARFAGEDQGLGRIGALATDCAGGRLYVLNSGPRNVATLDLATGKLLATRAFERELFEPRSLVIVSPGVVQSGGLWTPDYLKRPLLERPLDAFFEQASIGLRLSLNGGGVSPGFPPLEARCFAGGACLAADVDAFGEGKARRWITAQGISTSVALYDDNRTRLSTIAVASPKFVRDGTELPARGPSANLERWRSRNSVIRRVFALDRYFAVVHSRTIIGPTWTFGEQTQFEVFMNLYGADGTALVSDVRLPDLPLGRDTTHLYAIDYGPSGRGNASEHVALVRIPVGPGAAIVQ